ncbi:13E12 repeat family protein, partial [Herbiconiux daphne]
MFRTAAPVDEVVDAVVGALAGLLVVPARSLTSAELLGRAVLLERVARLVGAGQVEVAGEIGHRSRPELGDEGLSRAENFTSPARLVAAVTGVSSREAAGRVELGRRLRAAEQLGGAPGPLPFPAVTAALAAGVVGVEVAGVISRELAGLARRGVAPDDIAAAEATLVTAATQPSPLTHDTASPDALPEGAGASAVAGGVGVDGVVRLVVRVRDLLDPDGACPREERQRELRSLTLSRSADGMFRGRVALTPEQGALWLGAAQALTSPRVAPRFMSEDEYVQAQHTADPRTGPQRLADTVTELIARAVTAPDMPHLAGATTTVNIHVALADLQAGRGVGFLDGVTEPLPVTAITRLRCHQPGAVTVFGDRGEVLHHGRTKRLFTPAQNRALAARDGGCVWPGCDRPPSWCETHHTTPWTPTTPDTAPGRTDIDNGVLLCHFHHTHLHTSSFTLTTPHGTPHLTPPPTIDPTQTPIPLTQRRTHLPTTTARGQSGATNAGTGTSAPKIVFTPETITAAHTWRTRTTPP